MSKMRILYTASEISPFLQKTSAAQYVRDLAQYTQKKGAEIRILVPRFGLINERKNRLHEVVRLSGVNIRVGDKVNALLIKVASIPNSKLQVYFIDNEEYFKRKAVFHDSQDKPFEDNGERIIFFCKSVLETAKKLGWPPDVIHCHDWMTSLVPAYFKTVYHKDPILKQAKVLWTLHNNVIKGNWDKDMLNKARMDGMKAGTLDSLKTADFQGLIKTGLQYADAVRSAEPLTDPTFKELVNPPSTPCLSNSEEDLQAYYRLYEDLKEGA